MHFGYGLLKEHSANFLYDTDLSVLLEFRHKHGRDPETEHMEADRAELLKTVTEVAEKLKVKPEIVPADFEK